MERGSRKGPRHSTVEALADALGLSDADRRAFELAAARGRARKPRGSAQSDSLRPALPRRSNLLVETSTYVGQERARSDVAALVRHYRLVTLAGPPGIGKTRLALQVARSYAPEPRDGIWLVECASFAARDHLIEAIAASLKIRVGVEGDPLASLAAEVAARNVLLILDNCEHIVDAAADVAAAIGQSCPSVFILATSRESLGVSGERVYQVPSLTVPPTDVHRLVDLTQYDAAALFLERSGAVSDRFEAGEQSISAIREIVTKLDGLPLAIELAAARTDQMSLSDMLHQLDNRLEFLSWGRRDAVPRQRTLRALIDWSFDLLSRSERVLLERVAIFSGGWTLEAARDICVDDSVTGSQCLGVLSSLVRKNLVVANTAEGPTRYSLLDSIHSYLLEKLEAAGETMALAGRHANWFASFAETMGATGTELQSSGRRQLAEIETDNVNAALKWSLQVDGDALLAGRIAIGFLRVWIFCGSVGEGHRALTAALQKIDGTEHPLLVTKLWLGIASSSFAREKVDAAQQAVARLEALSEPQMSVRAFIYLCEGLLDTGHLEDAEVAIESAYAACRHDVNEMEPNEAALLGVTLGLRAWIMSQSNRCEEARRFYDEALALSRSIGNEFIEIGFKANLATLEVSVGNHQAAIRLATDACAQARRLRYAELELSLLTALLGYHAIVGDAASALLTARGAIAMVRQLGQPTTGARIVQHVAAVIAKSGDVERAARMLGYADAAYARVEYQRDSTEQETYDMAVEHVRKGLTWELMSLFESEGRKLRDEDAIDEALEVKSRFDDATAGARRRS